MSTLRNFSLLSHLALTIPLVASPTIAYIRTNSSVNLSNPISLESSGIEEIALLGWAIELMNKRPPSGGDRGPDDFCALFPDPMMVKRDSFSTLPVYAWHPSNQSIDRIEIRDGQTLITEIEIEEEKSLGYVFHPVDSPLERGETYIVYFLEGDRDSSSNLAIAEISILAETSSQYERLSDHFGGESNIRAENEQQAQAYSSIFADEIDSEGNSNIRNLWMDVARQVLSIPEAAPDFLDANYQKACP